jgi:hypothetical protein
MTFTKALTLYRSRIYPLHHPHLSPPYPTTGIVSAGHIFPCLYMST